MLTLLPHEEEHVRIVSEAIRKANEAFGLPKQFGTKELCEAYYKIISAGWENPVLKAKQDQENHSGCSPSATKDTFEEELKAGNCLIKEVECGK